MSSEKLRAKGLYIVDHLRNGEVLSHQEVPNLVVLEGRRYLLDAPLLNSSTYTEKTSWYIGLVEDNVAPSAAHVYDTFSGTAITEANAKYDEATREAWTGVLDGSAASITNAASRAEFTFNDTDTIYGAFLCSNATKGDHTAGDYLYSYSQFASPISVISGDVIAVTIVLTLSDS